MSAEIADWLLKRIDEDEERIGRVSLGATGPWRYQRERFHVVELDEHGQPRFSIAARTIDRPLLDVTGEYMETFQPGRMRAECEAKRRIVQMYMNALGCKLAGSASRRNSIVDEAAEEVLGEVIREMAFTFAARDGYREEWRPCRD